MRMFVLCLVEKCVPNLFYFCEEIFERSNYCLLFREYFFIAVMCFQNLQALIFLLVKKLISKSIIFVWYILLDF